MSRREQLENLFKELPFFTASGAKTLMDGAANPGELIRVLCDRPFSAMPIDELHRMAAWTFANPHRAKKRLGAFVMRWAARWTETHKRVETMEWGIEVKK